jgi:hypothetical protein
VLASESLPRRRDSVETIGAALLMAAEGAGRRTIAARLDRHESTVRNWLQAARGRAEWLRQTAIRAVYEFEPGHGPLAARTNELTQAVDALGCAAAAIVRRLGLVSVGPWRIIAMVSRGQLLASSPDG